MELYVRNKDTNERETLSCDADGRLKIWEDGLLNDIYSRQLLMKIRLDSIDLSLLAINASTARINLETERSAGNCFIATHEGRLTSDTNAFYSLLNPSGSGKTIYIHSISFGISDHVAVNAGGVISFQGFQESNLTPGSNASDGKNMRLGEPDAPAQGNINSSITGLTNLIRESFSFSSSTAMELFQFAHNIPEYIEVPEGRGVCFSFNDDTGASHELDYNLVLRFVMK